MINPYQSLTGGVNTGKRILLLGLCLIAPVVLMVLQLIPFIQSVLPDKSFFNEKYLIFFAGLVIATLLLCNFKATLYIFIASIFVGFTIWELFIPMYFAMPVLFSFLICYKFHPSEIKNDINKYFAIYLLSILPSYFFSGAVAYSILLSYHLFAFVVIYNIIAIYSDNYEKIHKILKLFVLMAVANAINIIYMAFVTGKRVFGFSGLMYVDIVCVAIIIVFVLLLYYNKDRFQNIICLIFLTIAVVLTQTRGVWVCVGLTIILIIINFVIKSKSLGYNRIKVIFASASLFLAVAIIIAAIYFIFPTAFSRLAAPTIKSNEELAGRITAINSFATRYFIWNTSFNAFKSHPIFGIGIYSFKFVSKMYSTIDPVLFKLFVEALVHHTMVLAVLTETGIVGGLGFLYFFINTIRYARRNVKKSRTREELSYSSIIFWIYIYMCFSFVTSDAWLWGTLIMVWSIINGLSISNYKILESRELAAHV